ncbi:CLUMA_CG006110, isoform A [Clunio marinus]|uniref:CLUMA_CG006110, isoform A n=1 Tax=Clunio marinus TaxID=568069 RepID=A0A1J1HWX8_9DIPT|nr:CLUMA_CG006110, isoform A [Clunio marinus]
MTMTKSFPEIESIIQIASSFSFGYLLKYFAFECEDNAKQICGSLIKLILGTRAYRTLTTSMATQQDILFAIVDL